MKGGIAILLSKGKPKMDMSKDMPMDKEEGDYDGKTASMEAFAAALEAKDFAGMSKALEDHYEQCE